MANTGMKGLFAWCKKHTEGYRGVNVTNMSSSWKDGLAFCAVIHRFRPDLIDFESLSKENVFYNNQLAFEIAEKELGIAALLDAEDMANMKSPDRLSVMTYLSQYYNCFRHYDSKGEKPQNVSVVNPDSPAKVSSLPRRSTDESICCICGKRVHLVQRYFEDGKLYHRTCNRTKSLDKIRGKNYFVQQQQETPETEVAGVSKVKHDTTNTTAFSREVKSNEHQRRGMESPNFVESLGSAEVKTVNIFASSPSPVTEGQKLPSALHMEVPSLTSELPTNKESQERITTDKAHSDVPMPSIRTSQPSTEGVRVSPAPVAQPRSKVQPVSKESQERITTDKAHSDVPMSSTKTSQPSTEVGRVSPVPVAQSRSKVHQKLTEREKLDDNETLNPFGANSGSDSDTTLSSESSEEDFHPFEKVPKKPVEAYHSPVSAMKELHAADDSTEVKEGNPFENAAEKKSDKAIEDDASFEKCGNPFGGYVEATQTDIREHTSSGRLNPFSPDFKDLADNEKKRPAPVPPEGVASIPVTTAQKIKSPHKKAPAPPPPAEKKQSASLKMREMSNTNENVPRFTQKQSTKPSRHPMPSQSPTKTDNHAAKQEKRPTRKKTRSAPGYGYPLVKRKVEIKMSEGEIATELKLLDIKLIDYETKGVKLEEMLRFAMDHDAEWTSEEDELLQEWFELVNKKNILLREESDLVFQMQQQRLEQEHADIEFQMRKLLNKPDSAKTDQDKIEEEELLKKLIEVVESRDVIIKSIDEERHKEAEEDMAYAQMKRLRHNSSKKKKNKVKKMFSKKDKTKKEKKHAAKEQQS